jgi:protein SCO1/2
VPDRRRIAVLAGLLAAGLGVVVGGSLWRERSDAAIGRAIGGPFTLTDPAGRSVTERDLRGRYALIYFGYTYCPDVCPTTLTDLAGALHDLGAKADRVTPVFITVDPRRDTPKVMGQYTAAFSPRLLGLTGTPAQIAQVEAEYGVYAARQVTGPGADDYTMAHSSLLYLMAPNGRFLAPIAADQSPAQMAAAIARSMS